MHTRTSKRHRPDVRLALRVTVFMMWGLLGCAALVAAQVSTAVVVGTTADEQGGALPGVTLTLKDVQTGINRSVVTDGDGRYRIAGLPPGRYELTSELAGFARIEIAGLELSIGQELRQDLRLVLSSVEETVTVRAQAPQIEITRADVTAVVAQEQIETLPIEGRSPIRLALLLPGTGTDATRPQRPGANVGSGGITVASTNYIVDGLNNMISMAGDAREDVPQSAVLEFKVHTAQMPAEFGGRSGGVVNLATRSGTNQFRGELFDFFRHKHLNALNVFQQARHERFGEPKPEFSRYQYGAAVGGPIVRNRAHFFAAVDRTHVSEPFQVITGRSDLYGSEEGTFDAGSYANLYFFKGDVQITGQQRLSLRHSRQNTGFLNQGGSGNTSSYRNDQLVPGFTFYGAHTWQIAPRILNEFAALGAESTQGGRPGKYAPAAGQNRGGMQYGFPSFSWGVVAVTDFWDHYYQFRNATSIVGGRHLWKVGVGAQVLPSFAWVPDNPGTWTFATDQYFNPSDPSFSFNSLTAPIQFQALIPDYDMRLKSRAYEAYVQDEWRVTSDITLNLGLRYDRQTKVFNEYFEQSRYPRPLPYVDFAARGDRNNFAPRAGLAWNVGGGSRTLVRGGYGLVYANLQNAVARGEHDAFTQYAVNIVNPSYPDPYGGQDPRTFISTSPPNITIAANDLENPEVHTASAGVSRELGAALSLHIDGVYSRMVKAPVSVAINTADPVTGRRPLPEWGIIRQVQKGEGSFDYRALLARLQRRLSNGYQYTVSYTLAKQDANWRPGIHFGTVTDANDPGLDRGPMDNDRRHSFVASGSARLPWALTAGAVWTVRSSRPFSAQAGRDLNRDGANNDYVPGTTRNQGLRDLDLGLVNAWRAQNGLGPVSAGDFDSDRYNRVDIRVNRAFAVGGGRRIELIGQVFNVFGTDNYRGTGTANALSANFGRILEADPRQQAELAVRFVF